METAAKTSQPATRTADRVLEALATLAALLDRTMNEVKALDGDYQARVVDAVHKAEATLQAKSAQEIEHTREAVREEMNGKFKTEMESALNSLRGEFQKERERLGFETEAERERFTKEISAATGTVSELQNEKAKLAAEVQNAKEHAAAEVKRVKSEAEAAVATAVSSAIPLASSSDEIAKVEAKLAAVVQLVEDPATELSVVIRKNVEKLELEAYLKGLRYASGSK